MTGFDTFDAEKALLYLIFLPALVVCAIAWGMFMLATFPAWLPYAYLRWSGHRAAADQYARVVLAALFAVICGGTFWSFWAQVTP